MIKVIKPIFTGILAAFFALILETAISLFVPEKSLSELPMELGWLFFSGIIIEELLKLIVIYKHCESLEFPKKIIADSFLIGIGFSALEIILNLYRLESAEKNTFLFLAGLLAIHVLTSILAGYFLSRKKNMGYVLLIKILIANILLHTAYNMFILKT